MRMRKSVVSKLSIGVIAIVTLVIAAVGLANNILSRHYALESARAVMRFNSESILGGSRYDDPQQRRRPELIQDIPDSAVTATCPPMSHYREIVVSRLAEPGASPSEGDPPAPFATPGAGPWLHRRPLDEVVTTPSGSRLLHVTPIMNSS
jgi:hypothetical protein